MYATEGHMDHKGFVQSEERERRERPSSRQRGGAVDTPQPHAEERERRERPSSRQRGGAVDSPQSHVRVVCRLRPMNEREKRIGTVPSASGSTERKEVAVARMVAGGTRQVRSTFHFDEVFTSFSTQEEVFLATLSPLIDQVLAGYEATAFAYGQTGTGKTYTMEGDLGSDSRRGLVPRAAAAVIDALSNGGYTKYSVSVSYLEIYNEELSDLLAAPHQQQKLDLKDVGSSRGVCCMGLSEVPVHSATDILDLIHLAQDRRRVAETSINARSSRSHCIFTMTVRCRRKVCEGELENVGKLHLVDLAGSECAKKASVYDELAMRHAQHAYEEERERRSINQSLLTLGRVIAALRENSGRIPYRDSKLTRLLQDALGGRCKTVIIATISPSISAVDETISTLTYAEQASGIRNRPIASSLLRTSRLSVGEIREPVTTNAGGFAASDWVELEMKVSYLSQEVEEAQAALAKKYKESQECLERFDTIAAKLAQSEEEVSQGSFVRDRIFTFAEQQTNVANQLSEALAASSSYGYDLAKRLKSCGDGFVAMRGHGQNVCATMRERVNTFADAKQTSTAFVVDVVGEMQNGFQSTLDTVTETMRQQEEDITSFISLTQQKSAELGAALQTALACGDAALDANCVDVSDAVNVMESTAQSVKVAFDKADVHINGVAERGGELVAQQVGDICEKLASARDILSSQTNMVKSNLETAVAASEESHRIGQTMFGREIQSPLKNLQSLLKATSDAAESHASEMHLLRESGVHEIHAAEVRWQKVLETLHGIAESHSAGAQTWPPLLKQALDTLKIALASHSRALAGVQNSISSNLVEGSVRLKQATEVGTATLRSAIERGQSLLEAAWEEDFTCLTNLSSALNEATMMQNTAIVGTSKVKMGMEKASVELVTSLTSSVNSLASARAAIANEVTELRKQSESERKILSSLAQQREKLQEDVAGVQALLANTRAEFSATTACLNNLKAAQERRRGKALERALSLLKDEFDGLGRELEDGIVEASHGLDRSDGIAASIGETIMQAENHNTGSGIDIGRVAAAWSQDVNTKCDAVESAQNDCLKVAEDIEQTVQRTTEHLKDMEMMCTEWKDVSESVVNTISKATQIIPGRLESQGNLQSKCASVFEDQGKAVASWATEQEAVYDILKAMSTDTVAARYELAVLDKEVSGQQEVAINQLKVWTEKSQTHESSLKSLLMLVEAAASENQACDETRMNMVNTLDGQASDLCGRVSQGNKDTSFITGAVDVHNAHTVALVETNATSIGRTIVAMEELADRAESGFTCAFQVTEGVREAFVGTMRNVVEAVHETNAAVVSANKAGTKTVEEKCTGALASIESARKFYDSFSNEWSKGCDAAKAAMVGIENTMKAVGRSSGVSITAELERSAKCQERLLNEVESFSLHALATLEEQQEIWHAELPGIPVDMFHENKPIIPVYPVAAGLLNIQLSQPPAEDELYAEYRRAKVKEDEENSDVTVCVKHTEAVGIVDPKGIVEQLSRTALKEVNE